MSCTTSGTPLATNKHTAHMDNASVIGVNYAVVRGFGGSNFGIPIRFADPGWLTARNPLPVPLSDNPTGSSRLCSPSGLLRPSGSPLGPIRR